jgi:hypothetical protein
MTSNTGWANTPSKRHRTITGPTAARSRPVKSVTTAGAGGSLTGPKRTRRTIVSVYHALRKMPAAANTPYVIPFAYGLRTSNTPPSISISLTKLFRPGSPILARHATIMKNVQTGSRVHMPE